MVLGKLIEAAGNSTDQLWLAIRPDSRFEGTEGLPRFVDANQRIGDVRNHFVEIHV
jgi:hypothetical protein